MDIDIIFYKNGFWDNNGCRFSIDVEPKELQYDGKGSIVTNQ